MKILGQITLHGRQFRIRENKRMKDKRLCIEVYENGLWLRVCCHDSMEDVLWWLRMYECNVVCLDDCEEYQKSLKGK